MEQLHASRGIPKGKIQAAILVGIKQHHAGPGFAGGRLDVESNALREFSFAFIEEDARCVGLQHNQIAATVAIPISGFTAIAAHVQNANLQMGERQRIHGRCG